MNKKDYEAEIEKWATKLLELNAQKRLKWVRLHGLNKGTYQSREAIAGMVDDDPEALKRLEALTGDAGELEVDISSIDEARKDCQRRLNEAKRKRAVFEYSEIQELGKKIVAKIDRFIQNLEKVQDELGEIQNKAGTVANYTNRQRAFEVVRVSTFGELTAKLRDWFDTSVLYGEEISEEENVLKEETAK